MDRQVGIAVVGLGRVSESHIDGIAHNRKHCRLAAVVDVDSARAKASGERHGVPFYTELDRALQDESVEAIVVSLPHDLHAAVSIQALEAGRHVLVEKPMATNYDDAERMANAAEASGVQLMIGQSRRYIRQLQEGKARSGEIGQITALLYTFACHFDVETAPPWWRSKQATGGLVYPMLGSHSVDYTLWMREGRRVVSVYAEGASLNPDFEGDDAATLILTFDDGTHATNFLTINNPAPRHEGLVIGSEGAIYFTHTGDHEGLVGVPTTDLYLNGELIMSGPSEPHLFALQMKEFAEAIIEKREPTTSGRRILPQMRILEAAQASAASGQVVRLDR